MVSDNDLVRKTDKKVNDVISFKSSISNIKEMINYLKDKIHILGKKYN